MAYNTIEYNSITWNTMEYNKTAKSGHLGDFRCPKKRHFGPKQTRYKAKLCGYHEFDQTVAVGTKSGTPGPSEDLRGPQKGILRPKAKQAPFCLFSTVFSYWVVPNGL